MQVKHGYIKPDQMQTKKLTPAQLKKLMPDFKQLNSHQENIAIAHKLINKSTTFRN
jgi:hypothetical protein